MESLKIEQGKSSPGIDFDADTGIFRIKGESFPENAAKFYAPVMDWLTRFLAGEAGKTVSFELEIIYFNSSTSKVLMNIFELLENAVAAGGKISVKWICDVENETAIECGEEFKEDLSHLPFDLVIMASGRHHG